MLMALRNDLSKAYDSLYNKINESLLEYLRTDTLKVFHPALNKVKHWVDLKIYPPKVLRALTELLVRMNADHRQGHSLSDIFDQALTSDYIGREVPLWREIEASRGVFDLILESFRSEIKLGKTIPIVLLVMNKAEANELVTGIAFDGYPNNLRTEFKKLQTVLKKNGLADWSSHYQDSSAEWRPFGNLAGGETVEQIVEKALKAIETTDCKLIPSFQSIHKLNDPNSRRMLRQLRRDGCIVIADSISMRHPKLMSSFHRTALDSSFCTSIVTVAPVQSTFQLMREMTFVLQFKVSDLELTKRRTDVDEDYGVCIELSEGDDLQRWILDRVRKMYLPQSTGQTGIKDFMFANFGKR